MAAALKAKKAKKKSKRVLLAEAIRSAMRPVMQGYGFANPPKDQKPEYVLTVRDIWIREREGFTDIVWLQWARYGGPYFCVNWETDEDERMMGLLSVPLPRCAGARLRAWRWRLVDHSWPWIGRFRSIEGSVELTLRRLEELNRYLTTGEPSRHLGLEDIRIELRHRAPDSPYLRRPWP